VQNKGTVQRSNYAVAKDAQIKLGKEECTRNMEQRRNRQERSVQEARGKDQTIQY